MSLHRTNINLNKSDVDWLQRKFGRGWTEQVREIIAAHIRREAAYEKFVRSANDAISYAKYAKKIGKEIE